MGLKTRRNNLYRGLAVKRQQVQADVRTHLIHRPARDIFHRSVDLDFPPIAFDLDQPSCRCDVPCPAELSTVNPDAVHDHGQPTC